MIKKFTQFKRRKALAIISAIAPLNAMNQQGHDTQQSHQVSTILVGAQESAVNKMLTKEKVISALLKDIDQSLEQDIISIIENLNPDTYYNFLNVVNKISSGIDSKYKGDIIKSLGNILPIHYTEKFSLTVNRFLNNVEPQNVRRVIASLGNISPDFYEPILRTFNKLSILKGIKRMGGEDSIYLVEYLAKINPDRYTDAFINTVNKLSEGVTAQDKLKVIYYITYVDPARYTDAFIKTVNDLSRGMRHQDKINIIYYMTYVNHDRYTEEFIATVNEISQGMGVNHKSEVVRVLGKISPDHYLFLKKIIRKNFHYFRYVPLNVLEARITPGIDEQELSKLLQSLHREYYHLAPLGTPQELVFEIVIGADSSSSDTLGMIDPALLSFGRIVQEVIIDGCVGNITLHGLSGLGSLAQGVGSQYKEASQTLYPYVLFGSLDGDTVPESILALPNFPKDIAPHSVLQVFVFFAEAFGKEQDPSYFYGVRPRVEGDVFKTPEELHRIFEAFRAEKALLRSKFGKILSGIAPRSLEDNQIESFTCGAFNSWPELYKFFADFGIASAQNNFATMLYHDGVSENLPEAIRYFEMAAEKGVIKAIENLSLAHEKYGLMLFDGDGVPKDILEGLWHLEMAAKKGRQKRLQTIKDFRRLPIDPKRIGSHYTSRERDMVILMKKTGQTEDALLTKLKSFFSDERAVKILEDITQNRDSSVDDERISLRLYSKKYNVPSTRDKHEEHMRNLSTCNHINLMTYDAKYDPEGKKIRFFMPSNNNPTPLSVTVDDIIKRIHTHKTIIIPREKACSLAHALSVQILSGLCYLHNIQGSAHGNLNPSNIILNRLGNVILHDYIAVRNVYKAELTGSILEKQRDDLLNLAKILYFIAANEVDATYPIFFNKECLKRKVILDQNLFNLILSMLSEGATATRCFAEAINPVNTSGESFNDPVMQLKQQSDMNLQSVLFLNNFVNKIELVKGVVETSSSDWELLRNITGTSVSIIKLFCDIKKRFNISDDFVALKTMTFPDQPPIELKRAVGIMQRSHHPNIVTMFAASSENQTVHILMQLSDYGSLDYVLNHYAIPVGLAPNMLNSIRRNFFLGVACQLLSGGIYLKALKANINWITSDHFLVSSNGTIKFCSFDASGKIKNDDNNNDNRGFFNLLEGILKKLYPQDPDPILLTFITQLKSEKSLFEVFSDPLITNTTERAFYNPSPTSNSYLQYVKSFRDLQGTGKNLLEEIQSYINLLDVT